MFVSTTCLFSKSTGRSNKVEEVNEELKYKPHGHDYSARFVSSEDVIHLLIKLLAFYTKWMIWRVCTDSMEKGWICRYSMCKCLMSLELNTWPRWTLWVWVELDRMSNLIGCTWVTVCLSQKPPTKHSRTCSAYQKALDRYGSKISIFQTDKLE